MFEADAQRFMQVSAWNIKEILKWDVSNAQLTKQQNKFYFETLKQTLVEKINKRRPLVYIFTLPYHRLCRCCSPG